MEVMENFLGKWKLVPDSVEGFSEFVDALDFPSPVKEAQLQQLPHPQTFSFEARREGSQFYTFIVHSGDLAFIHTFRLGSQFHAITATGEQSENEYNLESHCEILAGKHTIQRQTFTSRRYLMNGRLVCEAVTSRGVVSRILLKKVPVKATYRRDKRVSSIISGVAKMTAAASASVS